MAEFLIKAHRIRKRYGSASFDALSETSLTFSRGELVAIIGPNGAGKSTLFDILAGLMAPSSGHVIRNVSEQEIGWCPQREIIDWSLTVQQNILLGFDLREKRFHRRQDISALAELLGLTRFLDRTAETLSGGELRRTQIARALAGNTSCVILDEPTTGLDPDGTQSVFEYLVHKAKDGGTALVSTHETSRFARYCSRVVALKSGRVIADMPASEFVRKGSDSEDLWNAYLAIAESVHCDKGRET
ncbi:unnamed protein product [Cylicostephanus goldi]|uniref:ABC transporter domain-containing protein n=1 Tax=Cylicostephanus goldi TaxID=71465 RepID=A0A3P6SN16_CYLGO|nr:unnamed protein product [Cylicostephanus goldi]